MINDIGNDIKKAFSDVDKKDLKICLMGIGSDLRGDDVAGLLVVNCLSGKCKNIDVIYGATAPENFTGDIKKIKPTHFVVVDCANMGLEPGQVRVVDEKEIGGVSFSTHMLPLSVMIDYLKDTIDFKTVVIGIQPSDISFGAEPCKEVIQASEYVAKTILKYMKDE